MKLLVYSNPRQGREDEFNEWYDTVHLPDVLSLDTVTGGQRYRVAPRDGEEPEFAYLTIYDVDGDAAAVLAEIGARSASGEFTMTDSLDRTSAKITMWTPLGAGPGSAR